MNIKKPKLVCVGETFLTRPANHHVPMFEKHFDISDYDPNLIYDKSHNFVYKTDDALESVSKYKNQGSRFIADGLWEKFFWCDHVFDSETLGLVNNGLFDNNRVIQVPKWFWFEEHIGQKARKSKVIVSEENKTNSFLMQVGKEKTERTNLLTKLDALGLLDNAIYSVLFKGKSLEGDAGTYRPEFAGSIAFNIYKFRMVQQNKVHYRCRGNLGSVDFYHRENVQTDNVRASVYFVWQSINTE